MIKLCVKKISDVEVSIFERLVLTDLSWDEIDYFSEVLTWLFDFMAYEVDSEVESYVLFEVFQAYGDTVQMKIIFYTDRHEYIIKAVPPQVGDENGYLGGNVLNRKSHAGEDWIRGNDLFDGDYNYETWLGIMGDIVTYELEQLSEYEPEKAVEFEENIK